MCLNAETSDEYVWNGGNPECLSMIMELWLSVYSAGTYGECTWKTVTPGECT